MVAPLVSRLVVDSEFEMITTYSDFPEFDFDRKNYISKLSHIPNQTERVIGISK